MTTDDKLRIVEMWNYMFKLETWGNGLVNVRYRECAGANVHTLVYNDIAEAINDMYHRIYRDVDYMCCIISAEKYS